MHIQKGTDVTLRQVQGGSLDGCWGREISRVTVGGKVVITVELASGELVTCVEAALEEDGPSLPRQLGS